MHKKEERILKALLEQFQDVGEVELTASGFVMMTELNITPYEAAKILRKIAEEILRDPYWNHNIYRININSLLEELVRNEERAGISESE